MRTRRASLGRWRRGVNGQMAGAVTALRDGDTPRSVQGGIARAVDLGDIYLASGRDPRHAHQAVSRAIAIGGRTPAPNYALGVALTRKGDASWRPQGVPSEPGVVVAPATRCRPWVSPRCSSPRAPQAAEPVRPGKP